MNYLIDFKLKNNDENIEKYNISIKYIGNDIVFEDVGDKYILRVENNIMKMTKENKESKIEFLFDEKRVTNGKYYIKELNNYFDTKIKTLDLNLSKKIIHVKYKLFISNEETGTFDFKITLKEASK